MFLGWTLSLALAAPATTTAWQKTAESWAAAHLGGEAGLTVDAPGLTVLANNDPVQRNSRNGRPMRLGDREFRRGLYCHAVSRVVVRLPGPGTRLTALTGIDSNDNTRGGRGSVVFLVAAGGRDLYRGDLLREGVAPVAIDVDLAGAREFELLVGDGGDGISCDQADWADARVLLADGGEVWLGDLPIGLDARADLAPTPPLSFTLDGQPSAALLAEWPCERKRETVGVATTYSAVWRQPGGPLAVKLEGRAFHDCPVVEWTAWLSNDGQERSGLVTDLRAVDTGFAGSGGVGWALCHNTGSICEQRDFEPLRTPLSTKAGARLAAAGGRGSDGEWPYFNLLSAGGRGLIVAVGWPGQWAADFAVDETGRLSLRAGQEQTRFRLEPGETARTPAMALLWHDGNEVASQNQWRRYMNANVVPRVAEGKLPPPQHAACSSHQFGEMIHADEASQITFVDGYLDHGLKLDYWWMDAGWYPQTHGWPETGTWEVDRKRFPRGFRPITDHGRERGVRSIVWFEPERVAPGTWLYTQHPEWLLGPDGGEKLLNLGNSAARAWLTDHVDGLLRSEGIDFYRQDFNTDPLGRWRAADGPDRQGLTENLYIQGYLGWWDELRRRHPGMLIDSCASGGRRNDLETMRRAVPLLRSDFIFEPVGQQCHTLGLAPWLPYYGSGYISTDAYDVRSTFCPAINTCWDVRGNDEARFAAMRARTAEWRGLSDLWSGDFYPLLPYSRGNDVWAAWQWHRPELDRGALQVFRRAGSPYETVRLRLQGLDATKRYVLRDVDQGELGTRTGAELAEPGLAVTLDRPAQAAIIHYEAAR
ncbi:MAG: NPCBM/NEW2 domain-containing protein [Armatimonadetes bacterium]|nr:NPCBM/NEW2 domain-containing protein [Armatimonadota bacterium]